MSDQAPHWLEELEAFCGSSDPLALALRGGHTRRFHTQGLEFHQNVAEHTWRMLVILHYLWPTLDVHIMRVALFHDVAEGVVGDLPAPIKRVPGVRAAMAQMEEDLMDHLGLPGEHNLAQEDLAKLKCADYLELALTCAAQPGKEALRIRNTALGYVHKLAEKLEQQDANVVHLFITDHLKPVRENGL